MELTGGPMRGARQSSPGTQRGLAAAPRATACLNGRRKAGKRGLKKEQEQVGKKHRYTPPFSRLVGNNSPAVLTDAQSEIPSVKSLIFLYPKRQKNPELC